MATVEQPSWTGTWALSGGLAGLALAALDVLTAGRIPSSAAMGALLFLSCAAVLMACGVLLGLAVGLLSAWTRAGRRLGGWSGAPLALLTAAAALLIYHLDGRMYRRLYPGIHGLMLCAEVLLLSIAVRMILRRARISSRRLLVLLITVAGLSLVGHAVLRRFPEVRFLAYQETTSTRQVLSLLSPASRATQSGTPTIRPVAPAPPPPKVPPMLAILPDLREAHLVLITVDTLRADRLFASRNGRPLMPHVSGLSERGVVFLRSYAAAPHTSYSLASLLTGSPLKALAELRVPLPATIAQHLGTRGFLTEAFLPDGLFFTGGRTLQVYERSGFGFAARHPQRPGADPTTDQVLTRLSTLVDQGEPRSFLWVHYFDPHEPYEAHAEHPFGERAEDRYDAEVAAVDKSIGRLLTGLSRLLRPVLLVITADHGEEFGEHGGYYHGSSLYDEQERVPLIFVLPDGLRRRVEQATSLVDVVPTVLSLLGEPPLPGSSGRDLTPFFLGTIPPSEPVIAEVDTKRMVFRDHFKLIYDHRLDTWELYDLKQDPAERKNLYSRRPEIAAQRTAELYEWLDQIHLLASLPPAIAAGRLGDRRALPELVRLMRDEGQAEPHRAEAARLIGVLEGMEEREALFEMLPGSARAVRAEAALSLGELFDLRALPVLRELLANPRYRTRAGIMLGRLRQPEAIPALLGALSSPDTLERRKAVIYLGRVGDSSAVAPLFAQKTELRTRADAALALGRIGARTGDPRVLPGLMHWLDEEAHADVRAALCQGLATLGDARAIPALMVALKKHPSESWIAEALVRLGVLGDQAGRHPLGGIDLSSSISPSNASAAISGFSECTAQRRPDDEQLGGGSCTLTSAVGRLRFTLPYAHKPSLLLLRAAPGRFDLNETLLEVRLNGHLLPELRLLPGWQEISTPLGPEKLRAGENHVELRLRVPGRAGRALSLRGPTLRLDRLLVVALDQTR